MKKIITVAGLAAMAMLGATAADSSLTRGGGQARHDGQEVSKDQYRILLGQCRFADTARARADCRAEVRREVQDRPLDLVAVDDEDAHAEFDDRSGRRTPTSTAGATPA